jgi:hypothetical protein
VSDATPGVENLIPDDALARLAKALGGRIIAPRAQRADPAPGRAPAADPPDDDDSDGTWHD